MKIPYFVVNAFTDSPFGGNPAGVCPLEGWLPGDQLQRIAATNNLSETAFFVPEEGGFRLRWFAPAAEVDLCGHATLASAFILYRRLGHSSSPIHFSTKSGPLAVSPSPEGYALDFPAIPLKGEAIPEDLVRGLGLRPRAVYRAMDWVALLEDEAEVTGLKPDFETLAQLEGRGVAVTAPGGDCDYVLRFFGPKVGVDEDPVTGSAQSMLAPFWSEKLGRRDLRVRQCSPRGGELSCGLRDGRVRIAGKAFLYLEGEISV